MGDSVWFLVAVLVLPLIAVVAAGAVRKRLGCLLAVGAVACAVAWGVPTVFGDPSSDSEAWLHYAAGVIMGSIHFAMTSVLALGISAFRREEHTDEDDGRQFSP